MNRRMCILPIMCLLLSGCTTGTQTAPQTNQVKQTQTSSTAPSVTGLRKFPYPYKAMLALSSDADHETLRKFNLIHEFLNTTDMTSMGKGLGLDIADSFFMYNGSNNRTYTDYNQIPLSDMLTWFRGTTNVPYGASVLDSYIKHGWLDTIHTYGDFSMVDQNQTRFTRALAKQAIAALKQQGDFVSVWTDHGNRSNVDNFGSYEKTGFFSYQQGANPWSSFYHTDFLIPYGIKFVWADDHSDIFGKPSLLYPLELPSGQKVWGFSRYTDLGKNARNEIQWVWKSDALPEELSPLHFQEIMENHDYAIVASHFCADNNELPFTKQAISSLIGLQQEYAQGNILVTRTSRLLSYNGIEQYLKYHISETSGDTIINIEGVSDPVFGSFVPTVNELHGITFYTTNPAKTVIEIAGLRVSKSKLQVNKSDGYAPSIGFQWFKTDTTNYTVNPAGIS